MDENTIYRYTKSFNRSLNKSKSISSNFNSFLANSQSVDDTDYSSDDDIHQNSRSDGDKDNDEDNEDEVKIPKIIMQTWKDKNVPRKWRKSPESIREFMKDWQYVLMTDEDNRKFVQEHFPGFLPYYDAFEYNIQRVDAIRYMWLYIHGGIYMDLDFVLMKPLDNLFKEITNAEVYLVSSGNIGVYITNSFMASKPRCGLWLEVIERMKRTLAWYYVGKHMKVMNTTGPIMLTHVVTNSSYPYIRLPKAQINPCSVCDLRCPLGDTYLRPLEGSSWTGIDTTVYNYFMCNWKPVTIFVVLILVFIILWLLLKYSYCYFSNKNSL
jgi:mannosyltransferase OCH1-like enzyme